MAEDFLVTRQEGAKILGVSTRTVDRYISQEKFSVVRENGKVLLDTRELESFKSKKNPVVAQVVKSSTSKKSKNTYSSDKNEKSKNISKGNLGHEYFTPEELENLSPADAKKYKILYEASQSDIENRDKLLRNMHYQLGVLETESKNTIPLLEAENDKREWEDFTDKLSDENIRLKSTLKSAKNGRIFFFILSLLFLFFILAIFVLQDGKLFIKI